MDSKKTRKEHFIEDFQKFTQRSIQWAINESEDEIKRIVSTLRSVMDDVDRRSRMSKETYALIGKVKHRLDAIVQRREQSIGTVIRELREIGTNQHGEISELARPLCYALQFQDRIRQILENSLKIAEYWYDRRALFAHENLKDEKLRELGSDLLQLTTCKEERDIIHRHIKNLPQREEVTETTIVF